MSRALARLRGRSALLGDAPVRVHLLTSPVALERSADVLLAVGAVPSATAEAETVAGFVENAGALLVNLGMLDRPREAAIGRALAAARALGRPWVLDPVKIGLSPDRLALARRLLEAGPAVLKLNRAELATLAGGEDAEAALRLARRHRLVVAATGAEDLVTDGERLVRLEGGGPWLVRVTATGCALGGLVAAFLAGGDPPFEATLAAFASFSVAARRAEARSRGPATAWPLLLDSLAALRPAEVVAEARARAVPRVDLRLYAILDPALCRGRPLPELARAAVRGGGTLLQLRIKEADTRAMVEAARSVRAALEGTGVPLVVNDRVDVALAAGAEGVHVGARDLDPAAARAILGPEAILGVTIHHPHEAEALAPGIATYAGLGPVFATASKDPGTAPLGPDGLARLIRAVRARHPDLPVCGIAGIDAGNAAAVIEAGARGVAVIGALFGAEDVEAAARRLRTVVDAALARAGEPGEPR
ncbi:MAG: thiamine phosphate synthase [Geminicoccaceae bacterium]|nr:thiamine phosphate synthase [Geminicoccaceae bacterium]